MPSPIDLIAKPDAVWLDLPPDSGESIIRTMHSGLTGCEGVADQNVLLDDLLERSQVSSLCLAADLALPHARTSAVNRLVLAVGRVRAPGAAFDAEHMGIRLVFLIGAPKENVKNYLDLVAAIARRLRTGDTKARLLTAANETEFKAALAGVPKR